MMASNYGICGVNQALSVISYNMRGFNSGCEMIRDLISASDVDIFMLQEHWLTPANLSRFDDYYPEYVCFGSSAMHACVEQGVLRGRPFGGVMTLVNRRLQNIARVVCAEERYVIVIVGDMLLINVYLPCAGTADRQFIYDEVFCNLVSWIDNYPDHTLILGGDFNVDLDKICSVSTLVNKFISDYNLYRCDTLSNMKSNLSTYYNEALGTESNIDYFLVSDASCVLSFSVLDPETNLSDHRLIAISYSLNDITDDNVPSRVKSLTAGSDL